uniref:POU class 2 homeobox 1 n=1 Tax=Jaculus jaculus TaxID=51337 RepID=A0A8C5L2M9_JACJA
MNNPPEA